MPLLFEYITVVVLSLALGSFASALIYRVPRGIHWAFDIKTRASRCPYCDKKLRFYDLVPLLSWLFGKGKCRQCGAKVSSIYPISEAALLVSALGAYWSLGFSIDVLVFIFALPFLWALLVIDLQHKILPDQLVAITGALGLVFAGLHVLHGYEVAAMRGAGAMAVHHLGGAALFALVAWVVGWLVSRLLKKEALGFGDVKFFAVAGLWLGLAALPAFLMASGVLGMVLALLWRWRSGEEVFPFGPALIVAFYALILLKGSLVL